MQQLSETDPMSATPRRWYRLHVTTWLALLPVAAFWLLVAVPGEDGSATRRDGTVYGWPLVWLERKDYFAFDEAEYTLPPPWSISGNWPVDVQDGRWDGVHLAADLLLAIGSLATVAALVERRRRRTLGLFRITLAELLTSMLVVGAVAGAWVNGHHKFRKEVSIAERLASDKPELELRRVSTSTVHVASGPDWLRKLIGPGRLHELPGYMQLNRVTAIHPVRTSISPAELFELSTFRDLVSLGLDSPITDEHCRVLGKLNGLQRLSLERSRLGARGWAELSKLSELRSLTLWGTTITDEELKTLGRLSQLEALNLGPTRITDDGLRQLPALSRLEYVGLFSSRVTDAGLDYLSRHAQLKEVYFGPCEVTAEGVARLAPIQWSTGTIDQAAQKVRRAVPSDVRAAVELGGGAFHECGQWPAGKLLPATAERGGAAGPTIGVRFFDRPVYELTRESALGELRRVPNLRSLEVRARFTDKDTPSLTGLASLEHLALYSDELSDKGLAALPRLPELRLVELYSAKVSEKGVERLARQPKLECVKLHGAWYWRQPDGSLRRGPKP
jgi:hypothetical protein